MKITHKLTICFLVFAILLWSMGYLIVDIKDNEIEKAYIENTGTLASEVLTMIDKDIHNKIEVFQAYSQDLILRDAVLRSNHTYQISGNPFDAITKDEKEGMLSGVRATPYEESLLNSRLSEELREKAEFYKNKYGYSVFPKIFVLNIYGSVLAMTEYVGEYNYQDKQWWKSTLNEGLYVKDVQYDKNDDMYFVDIGLRIDDENGEVIGAMNVRLNIEEMINIVKNIGSYESTGIMETRLITRDNNLIYSKSKDKRGLEKVEDVLEFNHVEHKSELNAGHHFENEHICVHVHSEGFKDFKGLGWTLLIGSDSAKVFSPVSELRNQVWYVSVCVTLLVVIMGYLMHTVISRPIEKLREAVKKIGTGNLDVDIDLSSNDEIGQLAKTFKNMASDLKKVTVSRNDLITEIESRKMAEDRIYKSRTDWENTFNTIPDMITIHDSDFNIINANTAAKEVLELPAFGATTDLKCYQYYHGDDLRPDKCMSCQTSKTKEASTFEMFEPHLNKHVEVRSVPKFSNDGDFTGVIHIVRDISNNKRAEDKIQNQVKRLNALRSVEKAITTTFDLDVTLDILLDQILALLNIDAAAVLLLDQHTNMLEYSVSKGFSSDALRYTKLGLGESNAGLAAMERRIINIQDLNKDRGNFDRSRDFREEGFVSYLAVPLIAKDQIKGVLELFHRSPLDTDSEWQDFLETIANQAATAIDNSVLFDGLQRSNRELTLAYDSTIEGWARALDMRDKETEGHSRRVTEMTILTALKLGIKEDEILNIRWGALLHDIGKMGVPDSILLKPGKLTDEEWVIMRLHPVKAYDMLYPIKHLRSSIDIPYCHHEKWDGTGYPRGLKGEEIPLSARIFAIVDVWDALSSDRPYRSAWPREKVVDHILSLSGTHFDPEMIKVFSSMDWSDIYHPDQQEEKV